jgi:hypothetical protein
MVDARLAGLLVAAMTVTVLGTSCRSIKPPPVIDPELASCVPAGTVVLAGVNLEQLRATALYQSLLPGILAGIQSVRDTSYLLIAYDAHDLLFVGRGKYPEAPGGATLISHDLVVSGPPESVRAAIAQHQTGVKGQTRLLDHAADIASGRQVWMVAQGGITLPFTGNATNLNRILHFTEYVTLAAQIDSRIQIEATGVGRTANGSRQLEESLRAILTFATAAEERQPEVAAALNSIQVRRDGLNVHAKLSTSPESAGKLIRELSR